MDKKKLLLQLIKQEGKNFDYFNTIKRDAYSMPSKFYATTVFYPKSEAETQTFFTTVDAKAYVGKELVGEIFKSDEFDTRKEAEKWIKKMYEEFLAIVL